MTLPRQCRSAGFTLIELLVVIAIIAVLASMLLPALARAKDQARVARCGSNLRQVILGSLLYADDHADEPPRSTHSAFAFGQRPWGRALASYLGAPDTVAWTNLFNSIYRCPAHRPQGNWSYGQNVYFELSPENDDYVGSPDTWRRLGSVPHPTTTILQAEVPGTADHVMAHFWTAEQNASDLDPHRHRGRANYTFVDGHLGFHRLRDVYDVPTRRDAWNPALAP